MVHPAPIPSTMPIPPFPKASPSQDEDIERSDVSSSHQNQPPTLSLMEKFVQKSTRPSRPLMNKLLAEGFGTMFIVIFGVGAVCNAVLLQTDVPLWNVTVLWGIGVTLAVMVTASISGGHVNPAVSLALAVFRPNVFSLKDLLPYWGAQYLGGLLGGAFNLMIFKPGYDNFEGGKNLVSASTFGEYFPAPGGLPESAVSMGFAFLVETWATAILVFVIFAVTDSKQKFVSKGAIPPYIGATVALLLTLYIPYTQGCLNPARDFGPRLVALMAGWGRLAIPGPRNGFWVYIIAPKLGGLLGALVYTAGIEAGMPAEDL